MESFTGSDAAMLHMEWAGHPMHTLKVVVLDATRRGRPVTVDELVAAIGPRLGLVKRATQKPAWAKGFSAIPFWVDDPDFDLRGHVDERWVAGPGTGREVDDLYSELAMDPLPADRPLWAATLVHGLEGGRQAVAIRVHHAVSDGLGALNAMIAASTSVAGAVIAPCPPSFAPVTENALRRAAVRRFAGLVTELPSLARKGLAGRREVKEFRSARPELPPFIGNKRNFCNTASGSHRLCATGSLPLADLRAVSKAAGVTINGVFHSVIGGAIRAEIIERGESLDTPTFATFGIAADTADSGRLYGNAVSPTNVSVFSEIADPIERLHLTASSCRAGVELRRMTGVEMADKWSSYGPRMSGRFLKHLGNRLPFTVCHLVTANVPGARDRRWFGDIEVTDWISFAVAVNPGNVNITAHSYCGNLNVGLITTPEVMPDPHRFLERLESELQLLVAATGAAVAV